MTQMFRQLRDSRSGRRRRRASLAIQRVRLITMAAITEPRLAARVVSARFADLGEPVPRDIASTFHAGLVAAAACP
jgi:hypothetical protein